MRCSKIRWLRSLRGRLLAAYVVGVLLTVSLVTLAFTAVFAWQIEGLTRRGLAVAAKRVASRIEIDANGVPGKLSLSADLQWLYDELPQDVEFRIVDASGAALPAAPRANPLLPPVLQLDPTVGSATIASAGRTVYVVTVPIARTRDGFFLQAASSERLAALVERLLHRGVPGKTLLAIAVSIPVMCGLMLLTLGTLLRPLRNISTAATRIEPRNLSARLSADDAPSEVVPLILAFNAALARLEHGYRIQQQFLGAAAHELKTPLALMRGQIEVEGTADRATLLNDIDVMSRQVHQLLHLAEVSEARNYKVETVAVAEVAGEVVCFLTRMADRAEVQLDLRPGDPAVLWRADKSALFTLLKNLMENAIQHSPPGGVVTVSVEPAALSVRDEGEGIAPEHAPHLFERFWRGPRGAATRPDGAGLGLSICHEIAVAHGWQLGLREVSRGAVFRVEIAAGVAARAGVVSDIRGSEQGTRAALDPQGR